MQVVEDRVRLHPPPHPRGAHCADGGAFVDNVPLLRRVRDPSGRIVWMPRRPPALDLDLGSGYCLPVDARPLIGALDVVADALNKGEVWVARAALASLGLPAFPQRRNGRLDGAAQSRLALALHGISLLKESGDEPPRNPDFEAEHPRQPKGSAGGIGGQFAPKPAAAGEPTPALPEGRLSSPVRLVLKGIVRLAKKHGWAAMFPDGVVLNTLYELLEPTELNGGEEEALAHLRAEHDFAGGKSLEEIRAHQGGKGYQTHHFLENTRENRENLPPGLRDAPENKGNIPTLSHEELHAQLSRKDDRGGYVTLRDSLRGKPVEEQLEAMFELMRKLGLLK